MGALSSMDELPTYRQDNPQQRPVDRLFLMLASCYGRHWLDMWAGVDINEVKDQWEQGLKGVTVGQVRDALDYCADGGQKFPPTLPEFKNICHQMKKPEVVRALPRKFTAEDQLKNHTKMQEAMAHLGGAKGNRDWARKILERQKRGEALPDIAIRFAHEALGTTVEASHE